MKPNLFEKILTNDRLMTSVIGAALTIGLEVLRHALDDDDSR